MLTVILTGGASRRMGRDKATLPYAGGTMLESLVKKYAALGPVAVSVNRPGRFDCFGARELPDFYPDMGPLNGLISAFRLTQEEKIFLTATDIPDAPVALAQKLEALLGSHDACIIRRRDGKTEPLFGIYTRACLAPAVQSVEAGRRAIFGLFSQVDVVYAEEETLAEFPLDVLLRNVNTPEEYQKTKLWRERNE